MNLCLILYRQKKKESMTNFNGIRIKIKERVHYLPYPDLHLWAILARKYKDVSYYNNCKKSLQSVNFESKNYIETEEEIQRYLDLS